ncbi:hypothetical protein EDB83DRAFT_1644458 [Lactarius deliciosus]|nr:hypothetical protein EDB83DRAFT_1644458 [Lactarius deliciosus]
MYLHWRWVVLRKEREGAFCCFCLLSLLLSLLTGSVTIYCVDIIISNGWRGGGILIVRIVHYPLGRYICMIPLGHHAPFTHLDRTLRYYSPRDPETHLTPRFTISLGPGVMLRLPKASSVTWVQRRLRTCVGDTVSGNFVFRMWRGARFGFLWGKSTRTDYSLLVPVSILMTSGCSARIKAANQREDHWHHDGVEARGSSSWSVRQAP